MWQDLSLIHIFRHEHYSDKAYDPVILPVVSEADTEITRSNGEQIPQLLLTCPCLLYTSGQHACHNKRLLKDILRDEWGFDGVVVSDWGGVHPVSYTHLFGEVHGEPDMD